MSEMIERVARAIAASRGEPWEDSNDLERTSWIETATAVIAAMRAPTPKMKSMGHAVAEGLNGQYLNYETGETAWHAMIDAALATETPKTDGDKNPVKPVLVRDLPLTPALKAYVDELWLANVEWSAATGWSSIPRRR